MSSNSKWVKRNFIGMYKNKFVCSYGSNLFAGIYAKQIKQTHKITIDGKEIEISNESFQELKKQLIG